jgi:penicillin amidase
MVGILTAVIALAIAASVICIGGTLWLKYDMRATLPQLDGQLSLHGLTAPVTVSRDQHGVPHIQATSLDDLFTAQGYVAAQDRLWQMDMARRMASGSVSEILGSAYLKHDQMQRTLLVRETAERMVANFNDADRRYFEDYARGVNAFIDTHEDDLPPPFRLLMYKPEPWQPTDSAAILMGMVQMMDQTWDSRLDRERVVARLGPTLAASLYPVGSWRDHPPTQVLPDLSQPNTLIQDIPLDSTQLSLMQGASPKDLLELRQLVEPARNNCRGCTPGSNEWVVSGAHTASHQPILSNDMHLPHQIPNIWYETGLEAPGFHAAGVTLAGVPYIIAGHNDHIAWGFTAMYGDMQDLYVEQTRNGDYHAPDGSWQPIEHQRETIRVRFGHDVSIDVARTGHGPVVTPLILHEKRTIALRWSAYDIPQNSLALFALNTAANWSDFRNAMSRWWGPSLNVVYSDGQGHIGYQAVGQIPNRPNGIADVPISGGGHEWQGYIPFNELPSTLDPANGIIATANARMTPDNYAYAISDEWADPYRNERIWKWLAGKDNLTPADMLTLQTDVYSEVDQELAQRFAYAIDHSKNATPRLRQAADLIRTWDGKVGIDSAPAAIVEAAKSAFWPMLLQPKLGDEWKLYKWTESGFAREQFITNNPAGWLPPGYATWDDFLAAVVLKGLSDAPADLKGWRYGDHHRIDLEHPLYSRVSWLRKWTGTGPQPQSGDTSTVKQAGLAFGPSQRFTIDWSSPDAATENIVMGESEDPLSPYYRDQWPYWYNGKTFALPFSDAAIQHAGAHTLRLIPAK